jgi:uncharacterized protein YeaO (DUF488 family)
MTETASPDMQHLRDLIRDSTPAIPRRVYAMFSECRCLYDRPFNLSQSMTAQQTAVELTMPAAAKPSIQLKRAYDPPSAKDGTRVLVDRLWPRGLRKVDAAIDEWIKDIAPSTELRRWFSHDPKRWLEFRRRYRTELSKNLTLVNELRKIVRKGRLTLVYSAHDEEHNNAVVLREVIKSC